MVNVDQCVDSVDISNQQTGFVDNWLKVIIDLLG